MSPRQAQRMAGILMGVNLLLLPGALAATAYVILAYTHPNFLPKKVVAIPAPVLVNRKADATLTLDRLKGMWESKIIETAPPKQPTAPVSVPKQQQPAPPIQLPFEYVGIAAHSNAQESFAFLRDKRSNRQILVFCDMLLPDTDYRIDRITPEAVHIQCGQTTVVLEKPKLWQALGHPQKSKTSDKNRADTQSEIKQATPNDKMVIADNTALAQYGIRQGDKIVAIDGKRMSTRAQFRETVAGIKQSITPISLLQQGKILTLTLPTTVVAQILGKER